MGDKTRSHNAWGQRCDRGAYLLSDKVAPSLSLPGQWRGGERVWAPSRDVTTNDAALSSQGRREFLQCPEKNEP